LADITHSGFFISPRMTWSVVENMDVVAIGQWSDHRKGNEFSALNDLLALRLKWYL